MVLKLFWLKYPFKKKKQAKYPLTTQRFALKYSEMIGISNDNDISHIPPAVPPSTHRGTRTPI